MAIGALKESGAYRQGKVGPIPTPAKDDELARQALNATIHMHALMNGQKKSLDTNGNPTLLFEPSQTQLEANAEAFFSTSTIRIARRALHIWHDAAVYTHQNNVQAFAIATAHDRRTLIKQAFDVWRNAYLESREERRLEENCLKEENKWFRHWEAHIVDKAFTHWRQATFDQRHLTELAKKRILQVRYFSRWKALTVENTRN
ncbi:hypothetical protein KC342_g97 [Hortaea werneckii]|nr:hypothetical protein KC342_g97 [Hortaea werneckii]